MKTLRIPVINAGNGIDEHPTQALSDLYAIFKWRPELLLPKPPESSRIRVGIIGTPNRMRTVRSLLTLFARFPDMIREVVVIHHRLDRGRAAVLPARGGVAFATGLYNLIPTAPDHFGQKFVFGSKVIVDAADGISGLGHNRSRRRTIIAPLSEELLRSVQYTLSGTGFRGSHRTESSGLFDTRGLRHCRLLRQKFQTIA
jgi:hypothetical protein